MRVDKERANILYIAIKNSQQMISLPHKGNLISVRKYSFTAFLVENGLMDGEVIVRFDEVLIPCMFHDDFSPSFSFNEKKGVCHCLSCKFGGTLLELMMEYEYVFQGIKPNFYKKIDSILKSDPVLIASVGFSTIYTNSEKIDINNINFFKVSYSNLRYYPSNYVELSSYMKKHKSNKEEILMCILLMQSGFTPLEIYKQIYGIEGMEFDSSIGKKYFDITEEDD